PFVKGDFPIHYTRFFLTHVAHRFRFFVTIERMISRKRIFFPTLFILAALLMTVAVAVKIRPTQADKDDVILADRVEKVSRNETNAPNIDSDGDSLKDWEETLRGTNPQNPDSDGDRTFDGEEVIKSRNPLLAGPNDLIKEKTAAIKSGSETQDGVSTKAGTPSITTTPNGVLSQAPEVLMPTILSAFPDRVRKGDTVTITGVNFTPTNNTISLIDGPANQRFYGLASPDGKTLTFVYSPPEIEIMTEAEIRALPANIVDQIERPLQAAGMTIADALKSYSEYGIKSEAELRSRLESGGQRFEDVYHYFFVQIENAQGSSKSEIPLLHGLPKMVSDLASVNSPLFSFSTIKKSLQSLLRKVTPVAYAQMGQQGGGFFSIVLICTCNFDGWMDYMNDYSGGGSGLWKFTWGTISDAGFAFGAGYWLGGYTQGGATCSVGVRPYCADISGSTRKRPFGTSM
ncbi:MAG TPA: hypothetical protein DEF00_02605, partial [Candidatus Taylorbacteria bacterium]|nr:hypothetical protein [Candidatus Taylorbacteria bacterium]